MVVVQFIHLDLVISDFLRNFNQNERQKPSFLL